ncbi:hypothetical protein [uncultured Peptoniphilus sp.]|uniref:hypothetical protein n=1 Tax=uncultured Peptoniphilus sp. TaxID=254354 RepID=UPI002616275E|nr:hypothetical protein [uncultured Peptoniphilus sp.]
MKNIKIIIISLIAILFFTACGKNENSSKDLAEKNKVEEKEKNSQEESKSRLFIARENLGESSEKFPLAEIKGSLSDGDYEKIFMGVTFNNKDTEKTEDTAGDLIIYSDGRIVKLSNEKVDGIYKNEEIRKGNSKIIESKDNLRDKALELLLSNQVQNVETMKNPGDHQIYCTQLVKDFFEDGKLIFLAIVTNENYSYKNGIFNSESGYTTPMELRYVLDHDKNFVFDEKIEAMDGAGYGPSIQKMARGDEDIYGKLMFSDRRKEHYDRLMEELFYKAQESGLKDFTHKLEEVPGYEKDVVYIENGPNHYPGTIEIAKKKDYEEAKKKVGTENWTYCEGVVYHKATGIAVKGIIDYFE